MKKEENQFMDAGLQKAVRRVIAEEFLAIQYYMLASAAVAPEEAEIVRDLFAESGWADRMPRLNDLMLWCREYGYDFPSTEREIKSAAGKKILSTVQGLKKGQPAMYYVERAALIETEEAGSFKAAIGQKATQQFTDLQGLLWQMYYRSEDVVNNMKSATIAIANDASMIIA